MGKVFQGIFGGEKQKASSQNQAYGALNQAFSPLFGQAANGANALTALLNGDSSGFNTYKNMTGFDAAMQAGSRGITGNAAANGLLRSGSTGKALVNYSNQMQNQSYQDYFNNLLGQAGLGFQAGNLVSGAGQTSQSSGSKKPGISKFLGAALAA